jgi:hypothetical protein
MRSTWPFSVKSASPPRPSAPALLDTAVSEWRDSGPRRRNAAIKVAFDPTSCQFAPAVHKLSGDLHAIPHNPNPALNSTEPLCMSATASSALAHSFESLRSASWTSTDLQFLVMEKLRMPLTLRCCLGGALKVLRPPLSAIGNCREHAGAVRAGTGTVGVVVVDDRLNARETLNIIAIDTRFRLSSSENIFHVFLYFSQKL